MLMSIIFGATTLASSTTLVLEGCITAVSVYGICKGVSKKTNFSFKH